MKNRINAAGTRNSALRRMAALIAAVIAVSLAPRPLFAATWGPETNLSSTSTDSETGLGHRPLAFDAEGKLHVVWAEKDAPNANYRIYARERAGAAWSAPALVVDFLASEPMTNVGAKYPALAASSNGDLDLFWHDYRIDGINNVEIYTKRRAAGSSWDVSLEADVRLTTTNHPETNGDNGYVPTVAVAPTGAVHVLWYDFRHDGQEAEILSKTRPAGGAWDLTAGDSADIRVTNDADHSELAACATDAGGDIHAAWRSAGAGARVFFARRDAATGTWSAPIDVALGTSVAGAPALAVDGAGRAHVVWPDSRDGGRALFTRVRETNGVWSATLRLTRPADAADEPSMVCGENGSLHLVWHDARVSLFNREVFHREKSSAASWDTTGASDTRVSSATGHSTRPSVAARAGTLAVLWKDARDGNHEIYIRLRTEDATAVLASFPSAGTTLPALRAHPNPAFGGAVRLTPDSPSTIVVVDIRGRVVRRLDARHGPADWDGRDDGGAAAPAGVYFARAIPGGACATITVLR